MTGPERTVYEYTPRVRKAGITETNHGRSFFTSDFKCTFLNCGCIVSHAGKVQHPCPSLLPRTARVSLVGYSGWMSMPFVSGLQSYTVYSK